MSERTRRNLCAAYMMAAGITVLVMILALYRIKPLDSTEAYAATEPETEQEPEPEANAEPAEPKTEPEPKSQNTMVLITGDEALGGMSKALDDFCRQGGDPEDLIRAYTLSDNDYEVLCRITEAEVTGEGSSDYYDAKRNVVSCILTRLENGWGLTVKDVVFAPKQFSPISDGRYYTVKVTDQTRQAVDWVLQYGRTHDCEYFCTKTCDSYKTGYHSKLKEVFRDSQHVYFCGGNYEN